ncbi:metallophosphoesterase [Patescibacteria group bacterium]
MPKKYSRIVELSAIEISDISMSLRETVKRDQKRLKKITLTCPNEATGFQNYISKVKKLQKRFQKMAEKIEEEVLKYLKGRKMKIAIMSDSHDRWNLLEKAIQTANQASCEVLLFAGDLIAPPGIALLEQFEGMVKFVWGNNEGERVGMTRMFDKSTKIELCGDTFEGEIGGLKVFMNHYPRYAQLASKSGELDLCVHGHTHEYLEEKNGECSLINPGEIQGGKTRKSSFVIFDTKLKQAKKVNF